MVLHPFRPRIGIAEDASVLVYQRQPPAHHAPHLPKSGFVERFGTVVNEAAQHTALVAQFAA